MLKEATGGEGVRNLIFWSLFTNYLPVLIFLFWQFFAETAHLALVLLQSEQWKNRNSVGDMFKVNDEDTSCVFTANFK